MKGEASLSAGQPPETTQKTGVGPAHKSVGARTFDDRFKSEFKDGVGLVSFPLLRWAEQWLSVRQLHSILKPFAFSRAAVNTAFRRSGLRGGLPSFLLSSQAVRARTRRRADAYLNQIVRFFPDRLAGAKWMGNCRMDGLDHLSEARRRGRPVILAFCHFGPYFLLRCWLRATGVPAATFVGGESETRMRMNQLQDRFTPLPEIPVVLHADQLRETVEFLAAGNPLLVAVDAPARKQVDVPFCEGWTFQMAAGPMRLASRHQAELIPCSIIDEGRWRFRIKCGPPVPGNWLASEADWPRAGRQLIEHMLPDFMARPEQCSMDLTRCLRHNTPPPTPD